MNKSRLEDSLMPKRPIFKAAYSNANLLFMLFTLKSQINCPLLQCLLIICHSIMQLSGEWNHIILNTSVANVTPREPHQ